MKKCTLLLAAAFSALFVLPLAACDNTSSFKVDDYALALDSKYLSEDALADKPLPTTAVKLDGSPYSPDSDDRLLLLSTSDSSTAYKLYDTVKKQYIGTTYTQQFESSDGFYTLGSPMGSGYSITLVAPNGQTLINSAYANSIYDAIQTSKFTAYVNGVERQILSVIYVKDSDASGYSPLPTSTRYFTYNSQTETYTDIQKKDFDLLPSGSEAGSQVIATEVTHLGADPDKGERPTSLDGWSVYGSGTASATYTFVGLNGETAVKNVLEVKNAQALGFLKNYFFYYEMEKVESSATSGYNVVLETGSSSYPFGLKYKATLYRYDIIKGKKKKLDCDYFLASVSDRLYNNNEQDYDMVIASGYEFNGGVAVVSSDIPATKLVINHNASVCLDLSTKPFSLNGEILKLSENRYFCDDTILDKDLNVISSLSNAKVYKKQSLIVSSTDSGRKFAVDFDGKLVLAPIYSSLNFYGDYALTTVYGNAGTKTDYIVSKTNQNGSSVATITGTNESDYMYSHDGLLIVTGSSYSRTIYNLAGREILGGLSYSYISSVRGGYVIDTGDDYYFVS